ncbi:MAG TPA: YihY/virulence factor BrkB family protein [Acidimicrobiales bacterium]|nr:YihY/virulence factor BrkB family protein [Acidimicrobiales bacterium]
MERLRRLPIVRSILPIHERVGAVGGGPLSSSIALGSFLSLFPLLLVGVAVLGFVSASDADFAAEVVDQLGLEGKAADQVTDAIDTAQGSRRAASVVGLVGLAWAGLGVAGALENALNATWQVKGRGITSRLVAVAWLVGAGLLFLGSMALGPLLNELPGPATVATILAGFVLDVLLFVWMFVVLTNVNLPWRVHLPGALLGAVGLEVLKVVGSVFVPRAVASSSALYGSLGVVFAILAWLALTARLVVYAAAFNVVRYEQQHGTVTVDIQVPHISGQVPLEATRGGAVSESASEDRRP